LDDIFSNATSLRDKLKAYGLHLKIIASRGQYAESTSLCLSILAGLGEEFPEVIKASLVTEEIKEIESSLKDVTKDEILSFPAMTDTSKLHSMRFLSMLSTLTMFTQPHICHLSSCHMVRLTLRFGFCDETVHGLAGISRGEYSAMMSS